ncbi:Lipoyltransferase and lipoate-protein ligase [Neolentinus lepideus HHB14362 ss-1]|uniref:Putative lipoate-protein ligase A n=1 Tax=Neolentinus lepideus HHB14362 ss-1 TaxID=1314782 RepID=A0A165V976_9AGAM|nr:Lipoyltransferase and lipoate-protein ligase [Neolentinus lepideus HHB14362 ss-1]
MLRSFSPLPRPRTFLTRHRLSTTSIRHELTPQHAIYVSNSINPYFNLSLEDWLFRHKDHHEPLLFLYRNSPCVVIGRNQNPWKEVNMTALKARRIPFIRRRSGGGTVYHDLGNTNYSIHLPRSSFDRHATAELVRRAINTLGIDVRVNDRNDICVGYEKVSGSAYKIVSQRAYHHGTMLISTRLDTLGALLKADKETMVTKGVDSVRSPVCNLRQFGSSINHETFINAVIEEFRKEYRVEEPIQWVNDGEGVEDIEYVRNGMVELPGWDWAFGQTPEFTYTILPKFEWGEVTIEIRSKHGIILEAKIGSGDSGTQEKMKTLGRRLEDQKYGFVDADVVRDVIEQDNRCRDVWEALLSAMVSYRYEP